MKLKINKMSIGAEEKNELYTQGYRYLVDGDYAISSGTDPWSGMPNTTNNVYAFSDEKEARAFAVKQIWVFNSNVHAPVVTLPPHTETWEEQEAREAKKKAEQKARREANERAKAKAKGMTLEEYKAFKKLEAKKKTARQVIENAKAEIKRLQKVIENNEKFLAEN